MQRSVCLSQGAPFPYGTGTASQMLLWSGRTPLWCCLFLFVPSARGGPRRRAAGGYEGGNAGGSWERDCCSSHLSPEDCGDVGMWEEAKGKETLASPVLQQFLRASLATMEDEAWTKGLSCELSRWLSSSPSSSGEKVGSPRLYPAVQPQVPNWGRGCGWCSAHTGRSRCFPGPCPPEGLFLQTAWGWPCSCSQRLSGSVGPSHLALSQQVRLLPHLSFFLPFPSLLFPSHAVFPVQGSGDSAGSL